MAPDQPWYVILPDRVVELEISVCDAPQPGSARVVAHCPGVGHTPGEFVYTAHPDAALRGAVLLVLRKFWLDGVPAVVLPPGAAPVLLDAAKVTRAP